MIEDVAREKCLQVMSNTYFTPIPIRIQHHFQVFQQPRATGEFFQKKTGGKKEKRGEKVKYFNQQLHINCDGKFYEVRVKS